MWSHILRRGEILGYREGVFQSDLEPKAPWDFCSSNQTELDWFRSGPREFCSTCSALLFHPPRQSQAFPVVWAGRRLFLAGSDCHVGAGVWRGAGQGSQASMGGEWGPNPPNRMLRTCHQFCLGAAEPWVLSMRSGRWGNRGPC